MSAASDLATYVAGLALAAGYQLKVNYLPDTPAFIIVFYDSGGEKTQKAMGGSSATRISRLQATIRHENAQTASNTAEALHDALDGLTDETIGGTLYQLIETLSRPFILDRDSKERTLFTFNMEVTRV